MNCYLKLKKYFTGMIFFLLAMESVSCSDIEYSCLVQQELMLLVVNHEEFKASVEGDQITVKKSAATKCFDSWVGDTVLKPKRLDEAKSEGEFYISLADFLIVKNKARIQIFIPSKDWTLSFGFKKKGSKWEIVTFFKDVH